MQCDHDVFMNDLTAYSCDCCYLSTLLLCLGGGVDEGGFLEVDLSVVDESSESYPCDKIK